MKSARLLDQRYRRDAHALEAYRRDLKRMVKLYGYTGEEGKWVYETRGRLRRRGSMTTMHRRCALTGRSRGVRQRYRRSRMRLRQHRRAGAVPNCGRKSW